MYVITIYLENVISILRELADKNYQRRAWCEGVAVPGDMTIAFTEAACMLFDDCDIGDLLKENEIIISNPITEILQSMSNVIEAIDEYLPEEEIINAPKMQIVREKAARILALIEASDGSESTVQFIKVGTPDTPITIEEALKATA